MSRTSSVGESVLPLVFFALVLAVQIGGPLILWFWGRRVAARRQGASWRLAAWIPMSALALVIIGYGWGVIAAMQANRQLGNAIALEDRATLLSNMISEAINCSALASCPALLLCLISFAIFMSGTPLKPNVPPTARGGS
jgi:hypothetical protein